jgi:hypothetical protein
VPVPFLFRIAPDAPVVCIVGFAKHQCIEGEIVSKIDLESLSGTINEKHIMR